MGEAQMNLIKSMEDFHFNSQQGMYFSKLEEKNGYLLVASEIVEDNYWNYAARINRALPDIWPEIEEYFTKRDRRPSIYLTPTSSLTNIGATLQDLKLSIDYTDAWMVLTDAPRIASPESPDYQLITLDKTDSQQTEAFVNTFRQAYSSGDPNDPYGDLPEYYADALSKSFQRSSSAYLAEHFLALVNGQAAGVSTLIRRNNMAAIYNVGTIQAYRNKGVGTLLTLGPIKKYFGKNGVSTIFLNTEKDSGVEKWYTKLGFTTQFTGSCFSKD